MGHTVSRHRRSASVVALLLCLPVLGTAAAAQQKVAPDIRGHWAGLGISSVDQSVTPLTVDITDQHEWLGQGTALVGGHTAKVVAAIKPCGRCPAIELVLHIVDDRGVPIVVDGELVALPDTLGLRASFTIGPPGHTTDRGALVSVQCLGGESPFPPDVSGDWCGGSGLDFAQSMTAQLSEDGSSLSGTITFIRPGDAFTYTYVFSGTISDNGLIDGLAYSPDLKLTVQVTGALQPSGAITGLMDGVQFILQPCGPVDIVGP